MLVNYGIISSISSLLSIPLSYCVSKHAPKYSGMFTKMGVSLGILILSFFTYLIYDIMAHSNDDVFNFCWENATYQSRSQQIKCGTALTIKLTVYKTFTIICSYLQSLSILRISG